MNTTSDLSHQETTPSTQRWMASTSTASTTSWSANSKEVSFNVHGIVYVPESQAPQDPLEVEVRKLSELLAQVKDEQSYIVIRERTHRNTAESTNARVKWWSIFQMGVLIGEGLFQVWWLKRFFEVKSTTRHGVLS
jgi:hypothetical protein